MDINLILNIAIVLLVFGIFWWLLRRAQAADSDGEMDVFEYGQLLAQAEQTARIIVRGVQEAWRTGELEDDEREEDAIDQLAQIYPQLNEEMLRRIVKSAVYLLRLGAGKQVDRVMEQMPDPMPHPQDLPGGTGQPFILHGGSVSAGYGEGIDNIAIGNIRLSNASLNDITEGHTL